MATQKVPPKNTPKEARTVSEPVKPQEEQLLHSLEGDTKKPKIPMKLKNKKLIASVVTIILLGIGTGYGLAQIGGGSVVMSGGSGDNQGERVAKVVGIKDISGKDNATGELVEGGIDGEGTHHLERPGGDSQSVYLTSSVVPLDDYVGNTVKIWGDTFAAQSAGWLIDVVRIELLE